MRHSYIRCVTYDILCAFALYSVKSCVCNDFYDLSAQIAIYANIQAKQSL